LPLTRLFVQRISVFPPQMLQHTVIPEYLFQIAVRHPVQGSQFFNHPGQLPRHKIGRQQGKKHEGEQQYAEYGCKDKNMRRQVSRHFVWLKICTAVNDRPVYRAGNYDSS
jgi:hypothetical protein